MTRCASQGLLIMTAADREALKQYRKWNEQEESGRMVAARILARLARNSVIDPKKTAYRANIFR